MRERRCGKIGWRERGGEREVRDREIASENQRYVDKDGAYTIAGAGGHESRMNGTERERGWGDPCEREKERSGGASTSVRDRAKGR